MQKYDFDVVIVGGGMVGLSMAAALRTTDLKIALVDNSKTQKPIAEALPFEPRVSALTQSSVKFFKQMGVWSQLDMKQCCAFSSMQVWDSEGTASVHFDAAEVYCDELGFIVQNNTIVSALNALISENSDIQIFQPETVKDLNETGLTLESGKALGARLVIGADGSQSLIRRLAGFKEREWSYGHHAIVTTIQTSKSNQNTAWQCFMPSGPLALLPLQSPAGDSAHYASIVWSCVPELFDELMALDEESFAKRLAQASEFTLGEVVEVNKRYGFPLHQRHATDYVMPGLALIGDSAHAIHPLAGQGANLGLADAEELAGVLAEALNKKQDIADIQVLSRYQRNRKGHNLGMMTAMEGFKRLFGSESVGFTWLRNAGMSSFNNLSELKNQTMKKAMGL